jgi:hypothetical protein
MGSHKAVLQGLTFALALMTAPGVLHAQEITPEADEQPTDEAAPADPDAIPSAEEASEAANPPEPKTASLSIVYTGGSKGIGSGEYHFKLPGEIRGAVGDENALQNVRAYHGALAQGPYRLIAHNRKVETLNSFLGGGFIECGQPNTLLSYTAGGEELLVWTDNAEPAWLEKLTPTPDTKSYSVCSNANEETAMLIGPSLAEGPDIRWRMDDFEFRLGLYGQVRVGEETTQLDVLGIPKDEPARRFQLLAQHLAHESKPLFVDAGSFVDGASSVRAGALSLHRPTGFSILERLSPTALVPGETELASGAAAFILESATRDLPYIATNWASEDPKLALPLSKKHAVELEGETLSLAFVGVVDPGIHRWSPQLAEDGITLTEPASAVQAEVDRLRAEDSPPHAIILLTSVGPELLSDLRNELDHVDLILGDTSAKSERLSSFSLNLRETGNGEHPATALPVDGVASARLKFKLAGESISLQALDISPLRVEPDLLPDAKVLKAISTVRSTEYPQYDNPLIPAIGEGPITDEDFAKIVCETIAENAKADAVFLSSLPEPAHIPGPLTELLVMDRLAVLDQLEVHYIPGDRFSRFLTKVYGLMPIHCGADLGSKWPKARGRLIEAERLYRVVTTDRARLSTDLGVLLQESYSPKILDKPSFDVLEDEDGSPLRMSTAVLRQLRALRVGAENPMNIADDLLARKSSDKPPMWLTRIRRVALNIERFKGADDAAYESIPETLATSASSFTLGGQVDVAMDYSSRLLLSDIRLRSDYTRLSLDEDEPQETADDIVLSSSISLPGASIPKIGEVGFMPYSEALLDSEFTAIESEDEVVPRQADLSLAFGLSARRFGAVRALRLGAFALRDLSVPEKSMEFGAKADFETRHVFGPGVLFTTLWNGSVWGNTPEDDESDLRFKLLLDTRVSLPLARYLNIALYGQGFLFQGRVPATDNLGASYSVGVSFDVVGSFLIH